MAGLSAPTPFGDYLLLDLVNEGGMAEVFRGASFGVGGPQRIIAIKRILPHWVADPTFVNMFIDEARIAVQIDHPNVVQIIELGRVGEQYYIAMEYVAGLDLRRLLADFDERNERLPIPHAVFIISSVCSALDHAHRKRGADGAPLGIVHRDVSPHNVLLGFDGSIKVTDFGIAKATVRVSKTETGTLKGKASYMSPEQVRGLEIDRRADIFAVGILLYELLTGTRLFGDKSDLRILERVRTADVPPPRSINPDIPGHLEQIILKALSADREQRYQWACDLCDDLQRYLIEGHSIFTTAKLQAFLRQIYAEQIEAEHKRMAELLGQAQEHGPIVVGVEADAPVEAMTVVKHRVPRPMTLIIASGSGKGPKASEAEPAATSSAPQSPQNADTWDDAPSCAADALSGAAKTQLFDHSNLVSPPATEVPVGSNAESTPAGPGPTKSAPIERRRVVAILAATVVVAMIISAIVWFGLEPKPTPVATPTPQAVAQPSTTVTTTTTPPGEEPPPVNTQAEPAEPNPKEPLHTTMSPGAARSEIAKARRSLTAQIRKKGILAGDVPELDAERAKLASFIKSNKLPEALGSAETALTLARRIEIDRGFIDKKLARFNTLSDANKDGTLKPELEKLGTDTATAMSVGDFKAANQHLNKAFRLLRAAD